MSPEERQDRGTELCQRLSQDVSDIAPPGIGHWETTWNIVSNADVEFMIALADWEGEPTSEALARVTAAYDSCLAAWTDAVRQFHQHVEADA